MTKYLILGGAGYIGSSIINYLLSSFSDIRIISIGRGHIDIIDTRLVHFNATIDESSLVEIDVECTLSDIKYVYNCSGSGSVQRSKNAPLSDFNSTCLATYTVLEFLRLRSIAATFVQLSSAAVYGNPITIPIKSDSKLKPISVYGYNNLTAENIVEMYHTVYGFNVVIIRLFSIFGNGLKKQLLWDACNKFDNNDFTFFGTGNEVRDWVHISDVTREVVRLSRLPRFQKGILVANGASGVGITNKVLLQKLINAFGIPNEVKFSGIDRQGDAVGFIADTTGGFECNSDIEKELLSYVKWFKQQKEDTFE